MGNSYYELPESRRLSPEVIQARLRGISVCAITKEGRVLISTTGVGADFHFSICEAFVRLGYLPPFDVVERAYGLAFEGHPVVLQACLRTVELYSETCSKLTSWLVSINDPSPDQQVLSL